MNREDLDWKQYQLNVDLYRGYLDVALKMNGYYYAVTGAIVSYCLAHQDDSFMRWSLLLPLVMSVALAVFFALGGRAALVQRNETFSLGKKLGFEVVPEIGFLTFLLWISAVMTILVSLGLAWLIWLL